MANVTDIADRLRHGRELLRRGAWAQARAVFDQALARAPDAATEAAAAEGVAEAAWWLDDDAELIERFEQAYRCHRSAGDDRGAARAAIWLGGAALQFRGEAAVAQGWFRRAGRLLEDLREGPEQGLLALFHGMAARQRGHIGEAIEHADRAVRIGRGLGSPDLEVQGMALSGMAHVRQGKVAAGMRLLDEAAAAALAGEVHEPASVWLPSCYLVEGCEQVRDWERAEQWCVLLAADALRAGRPLFAAEAWARLGELRRRQGRWEEAAELFRRGMSLTTARAGQAELHLDQGDPDGAADIAGRALDGLNPQDRLERGPLLEVLVRAAAAAGRPDLAASAVTELRETAEKAGVDSLTASVLWAEGVHSIALGDTSHGVVLLGRAVGQFERTGGPYDAARARLDLASALLSSDRAAPAAEEALAARETFERLGADADAGRAGRLVRRARRTPPASGLTDRQLEILRLLAVGLTNKKIAERLTVSEHTVKRHVANILTRLDVPSRAAAVAYASRADLL